MRLLFNGQGLTLGEAAAGAKAATMIWMFAEAGSCLEIHHK